MKNKVTWKRYIQDSDYSPCGIEYVFQTIIDGQIYGYRYTLTCEFLKESSFKYKLYMIRRIRNLLKNYVPKGKTIETVDN